MLWENLGVFKKKCRRKKQLLYLNTTYKMCTKVASSDAVMRPRRSFSVNPAADLIQRNAYNSYLGHLAKNNRNFLDRVGKRGECQQGKEAE